ncbi:MAG: 3-deoxy-D-manno-octulosonic acid transferase [Marinosulfonomonas sp.]|nr:3-deoxy-D-manno-octulosonic acid transferase [Marinosulfonomonas sp.]
MVLRALGGRESRTDLRQRFAATANVARQTPTIWLHGASIGEITSARHLIDRLLAQFDGTKIVVTVNTITARDLVDGWGLARVAARLAPLEIGRATERFLDDWNPKALISLENELWPKRFQACKLRNIPVLIAGGRLSERSARRWLRMGGLATKTMQTLDFVAPLDLQNGDQFLALGLPKDRLSPPLNLKATVQLAPLPAGAVDRLNAAFPRAQTILAASTHEGEELGIISAFSEAYKTNPDLRLILAPRHPHRAGSVAALLQAQGLEFSRRSDTAASPADHPVLLADTLGEMALWYSLAGLTVIGGTFTDKGGHTPFEPVQFGSAVVHGPDVANHRPAFDALAAAKGAIALPDLDGLPAVFHRVGKTDWQKMCQKATFALQQLAKHQSDVNPLIESLKKSIRIP